jgi:hypothetical protein
MYSVTNQRIAEKKPAVTNLKEVYYEHYQGKSNKQPAGADAPVSGGSRQVEPDSGDYKYDDINKASFYDILRSS